jgi:hypothetical protein
MKCSSLVGAMSSTLICWPDPGHQPTMQLGLRLPDVLDRLRQCQIPQRGQVGTECFGRLATKDEMVVKGLAARVARSTERSQGRR